jgi:FkbM family methyltransferase
MKIKERLLRTHNYWSRLVPDFYYPYSFQGGKIYLNIKESRMMLRRALGMYEQEKHAAIRAFLKKGDVFIDVGVNKGDFSLVAADIVGDNGRVLAFEPEPDNCKWIRKSIYANEYRNVDLYEMALSNKEGSARLFIGKKSGYHSLISTKQHLAGEFIEVATERLDGFLGRIGWDRPVNMIKIDVEGAEMAVLEGASELLKSSRRLTILLDIHPDLGVDPAEVCRHIEGMGYRIFYEKYPFDAPVVSYDGLRQVVATRHLPD